MEGEPGWKPPSTTNRCSLVSFEPSLVADGSQILFSSYDSKGLKAYVISSQGGTPQPLLPEDREAQSDPDWSPDGHKIVFSTLETIGNFNSVLRVLDLASHQIKTLAGSEGMWSPRWSPNGRFIFGATHRPRRRLKIFDFETQRWSVVQPKDECNYPTWSSDSQFIYFVLVGGSGRVSSSRIWRRCGAGCRSEGIPPHRRSRNLVWPRSARHADVASRCWVGRYIRAHIGTEVDSDRPRKIGVACYCFVNN